MLVAAHVLGTFVSILSLVESRSDCESILGILGHHPEVRPKQFQSVTLFVLSQTANQRFNRHGLTRQAYPTRANRMSRELPVPRSRGQSYRGKRALEPTIATVGLGHPRKRCRFAGTTSIGS